jgi:hypothetical protein
VPTAQGPEYRYYHYDRKSNPAPAPGVHAAAVYIQKPCDPIKRVRSVDFVSVEVLHKGHPSNHDHHDQPVITRWTANVSF